MYRLVRKQQSPAFLRGGSVAEDAQHRAVGLLLGEQARVIFVVRLVAVDDHVLRRGNQAVLDAAESAQRLLVGSRVEESDIDVYKRQVWGSSRIRWGRS